MPHALVIQNTWALGDTVCLSALARDLHAAYPGQYEVFFDGHYKNVFWLNNPHAKPAPKEPRGQRVELEYASGIRLCNQGLKKHFLSWFHHSFEQVTGVKVPVTEPRGVIRLTPEEAARRPEGRYWVVVAGGKFDMTAKVWSPLYWQQTVDTLARHGVRCVQAGNEFTRHFHPRLANVEQYVGKTRSERDFFALVAGSEGVVCGVTAAMHIAAVFDKPCVVIAGGREAPWWEGYTNCYAPTAFGARCRPVAVEHTYLHTIGLLDCGVGNLDRGCWKDRTVPIEQADHVHPRNKGQLCRKPVSVGHYAVPECMRMITPDHVVEAVMNYYEKGVLPPIGKPSGRYSLPVAGNHVPRPTSVPQDQVDRQVLGIPLNPAVLAPPPRADDGEPSKPVLTPLPLPPPPAFEWNPDWSKQLPRPAESRAGEPPGFAALDHPYVGGRFTLFVLGYGDNLQLMERCLGSILDTCPRSRFDLRVALNQPSGPLANYVLDLKQAGVVTQVYRDYTGRKKYPAMREMFHDAAHPVTTPYLCWFDDDSWCRSKEWMPLLAAAIVANHPHQGRLYGARMFHDLAGVKRAGALREKWFQAASWWRGRPLFTAGGHRTAPNGSQIVFASGGFWALAAHLIKDADIPDVRLNHNGGDATIGCQVTQAGYKVVDFSPRPKKEIIAWSDAPRRGFQEPFPWA